MYRSMFAINNINNGALSFPKAMPQKDSTSDSTSDFAIGRRIYVDTLPSSSTTTLSAVAPTKKWIGGSRDASQVTNNRRIESIGNGSLNASSSQMSYTTFRDVNTVSNAKTRARAGGASVPAKVRNYPRIYPQPTRYFYLPFRIYTGYFADNVSWFATATPVGGTSSGLTFDLSNILTATAGIVPLNSTTTLSVEWYGLFLPPYGTGVYRFSLRSDDASYMWIGPNAVSGYSIANATINNGGVHIPTEVTADVSLIGGRYYPFRIQFGNNTSGLEFTFRYKLASAADSTYTSRGEYVYAYNA